MKNPDLIDRLRFILDLAVLACLCLTVIATGGADVLAVELVPSELTFQTAHGTLFLNC